MKLPIQTFACAIACTGLLQRVPTRKLGLFVSEPADLPENFEPIPNLPQTISLSVD
jgi:hypothetical protein